MLFEKEHFPIIKAFDNHFEIKAIDHWEFRSFPYERVTSFDYFNPNDKWYNQLLLSTSLFAHICDDIEPSILRINLTNGGDWEYNCPNKFSIEFFDFLNQLTEKLKRHNLNDQ